MSKDVNAGFLGGSEMEPTRIQVERLRRIFQALASKQKVNCSQMGEILEVDRRTILRDLDFMRDRLDLPIDYNCRKKSFYFTKPVKQENWLVKKVAKVITLDAWEFTSGENPIGEYATVSIIIEKIGKITHIANGRLDIVVSGKIVHLLQKDVSKNKATTDEIKRACFDKVGLAYWIEDDLNRYYEFLKSSLGWC